MICLHAFSRASRFQLWLVQSIACAYCDWPEKYLWFWFYDIQLRHTCAVLDFRNQSNRNCGALLQAILSSSYTFSLSNPSLCSIQIWRGKYHKEISSFYKSNVGVARKVFPHWLQKTITHHCSSLLPIISRLGYRTNWLLGLGELLHVPFRMLSNRVTCYKRGF